MKKIKLILGLLLVVLVGFVAFGLFTKPKVRPLSSEFFSAERVADDLKIISKEHHSIEHPVERARVRQYLFDRLSAMGGDPEFFYYDSIQSKFGGTFDIGNVYCQFDPVSGPASSYVMFAAHLDSRFHQKVLDKTVYSYGAADDGYGLGVSLEALNCALKYRNEWKQGIKILFTDSEEHGLDGMRSAFERDKQLFDKVGLMINLEARGVKGPALLFETSDGNSDIMRLYKDEAKYPATYSITTAIYKVLPNFTDFTVVKDSIPGVNFSVIYDMDYYHTDKDCFDNINLISLQHYGAQIEPMLEEFLTESEYSNPDCFKSTEGNSVFFTIPLLGMISYPEKLDLLYDSIVFAILCLAFAFNMLAGGVHVKNVFKHALYIFFAAIVLAAIGEGIAFTAAKIAGTDFKLVDTKYIKGSDIINIATIAVMAISYVIYFIKRKKQSSSFVREQIFGAMIGMMVISLALYFVIGENFFLTVPIALAAAAMIFYRFVFFNLLSLPILLIIELLELSFLSVVLTAMTIGSLGIVLFVGFYTVILMTCLFECYMNQKR